MDERRHDRGELSESVGAVATSAEGIRRRHHPRLVAGKRSPLGLGRADHLRVAGDPALAELARRRPDEDPIRALLGLLAGRLLLELAEARDAIRVDPGRDRDLRRTIDADP